MMTVHMHVYHVIPDGKVWGLVFVETRAELLDQQPLDDPTLVECRGGSRGVGWGGGGLGG